MRILSFIIKPVSYHCNLSCQYCFYKSVDELYPQKMQIMPYEIAYTLIESIISTNVEYISFCWQGGEPTLAGLDFYNKIIEVQNTLKKDYQIIENSIQTNGILIDDDWCRFLSTNNFLVGISLDGPEKIHNTYRKNKSGKGTFNKVMNAIELMNKYSVQYNILALVTDANIKKADEVYSFFHENNFSYLQFIPCFEHDEAGNRFPWSVNSSDLGNFFCDLFDIWYQNGFPYISIRIFQDLLLYSINQTKTSCCWFSECNSYIVVEHNGDCYPCDFFVNNQWKLGNIMNLPLNDILENTIRNKFATFKRQLSKDCKKCTILDFCMGDCIRFRFTKDINYLCKSALCETWKMLFHHYKRYEEELIERICNLQRSVQTGQFFRLQRNDPCPCGSNKKFKKCCGRAPLAI